jgi:regulator of sigma E protease
MTIVLQVLGVTAGFGFLVFIHELGHFFAAKMCKVRILTFALGFGPDLIKHTYKGTKYCIKAVPFGGFVAMAGDDPTVATFEEGEYLSLKWYKKVWISFAGSFSNYVLGVFLFAFVFNIWGATKISASSSIGAVIENYPAAQAGLVPGDKIKSIDGVEIDTWKELLSNLKNKSEKQTTFVIERGTYSFDLSMIVTKNPVTGEGSIGIAPLTTNIEIGFFKSIYLGAEASIMRTVLTVTYLIDKVISFETPEVSGPIGIMRAMANATKSGMQDYLRLLAIISVTLGLFNLFPIPVVDGGMIVLFFVEGIIKKQISAKIVQIYNMIGLVFMLGIFLFATYSDILRLGVGKLFGK